MLLLTRLHRQPCEYIDLKLYRRAVCDTACHPGTMHAPDRSIHLLLSQDSVPVLESCRAVARPYQRASMGWVRCLQHIVEKSEARRTTNYLRSLARSSRLRFGFGNGMKMMSPIKRSGYQLSESQRPHLHLLTIMIPVKKRNKNKNIYQSLA